MQARALSTMRTILRTTVAVFLLFGPTQSARTIDKMRRLKQPTKHPALNTASALEEKGTNPDDRLLEEKTRRKNSRDGYVISASHSSSRSLVGSSSALDRPRHATRDRPRQSPVGRGRNMPHPKVLTRQSSNSMEYQKFFKIGYYMSMPSEVRHLLGRPNAFG